MDEITLLSSMVYNRGAYETVQDFVDERDLTAQGWRIFKEIGTYYAADAAASACDLPTVLARIQRDVPDTVANNFATIFDRFSAEVGGANIAQELLVVKREGAGERLILALEGRGEAEAVSGAIAEYQALLDQSELGGDPSDEFYKPSFEELFTEILNPTNLIQLAPKEINQYINGGVLPGHTVVVFGRVNVGKSLWSINQAAANVSQKKRTVFIDNEDALFDTRLRLIERIVCRPEKWCKKNWKKAQKWAEQKGMDDYLLLTKVPPYSVPEIRKSVNRNDPDAVILNQMRNLANGDNAVQQLDRVAHELRDLGKRTDTTMFLITAAKEGVEDREGNTKDKPVLQRSDTYSSKTGIPAVADLMIGYGSSAQLRAQNMACLSICKNKRGPERYVYVRVNPAINRLDMKEERT